MHIESDILEDRIWEISPELMNVLLKDRSKCNGDDEHNIFWGTSDYEYLGKGYEYFSPILPELITGEHGKVIMPRVLKHIDMQNSRVKEMAEVFTPSWICNEQNNLIDNEWFGRSNVFNRTFIDENGNHQWETNHSKIKFPEDKNWKEYVRSKRLEITCGEAPYLVSRYDATTGKVIPVEERIGLLDRKLRVVNENTDISGKWLKEAQEAYKSIYAYEWQGDSLLLAREALLYTFIENYRYKFKKDPLLRSVLHIAYIISWNIWQMDGLKGVIPNSCKDIETKDVGFFETITTIKKCPGCESGDIHGHTGTYCLIKEWGAKDPQTGEKGKRIRFIDLIK